MLFVYFWIAAQIIIEMIPVSSSGHLFLLECLCTKLGYRVSNFFAQKNLNLKSFYYFLHLPTLVIVCAYFSPQWFSFIFHDGIIDIKPIIWVICADMITGILFLIKPDIIEFFPIVIGFIITSYVLIKTSMCTGNKVITSWHISDAIILGLTQSIALLPGVSRLALTCFVGCLLGFSLLDAFCLSWLLQVPLMILAIVKSLASKSDRAKLWQSLNLQICLAIIISSGLSWIAFLLVIKIIQLNGWYLFGWYMILPILFYFFCV